MVAQWQLFRREQLRYAARRECGVLSANRDRVPRQESWCGVLPGREPTDVWSGPRHRHTARHLCDRLLVHRWHVRDPVGFDRQLNRGNGARIVDTAVVSGILQSSKWRSHVPNFTRVFSSR